MNQHIPGKPAGEPAPEQPAANPSRRWVKLLAGLVSLLILGISAYVVAKTLASINWADLRIAIQKTSMEQFAIASVFALLSFLAWTGYDYLAVRQLGLNVRYRIAALAAFACYSIANTLGFALATGGTVRFWIYTQNHVPPRRVASLIVIASANYWLGSTFVLGAAMVLRSRELASIAHLHASVSLLIGVGMLLSLVAYIVWVSTAHRRMTIQGVTLELPGLKITLAQLAVGTIDILCASAVLYALLPEGHGLQFFTYAAIYQAASLLGIASNVPGGFGPFEATMLQAIPGVAAEALLASLLLFRVVYYLIPFLLGLALVGAHEALRHWKALRSAMRKADIGDESQPGL